MQSEELKNIFAYHKDSIASAEDCFLIDSFDSSEVDITVGVMSISVDLDNGERRLFEPYSSYHDRKSSVFKKACIKIDGIAITVLESIDERKAFELHGLNFEKCIEKIWHTKSSDIQKWNKLKNKYLNLAEWQNELSKISDGYENTNREEIEEILSKALDLRIEIIENIDLNIRESYLFYAGSTVKNLSIVNDADMFTWQGVDFANDYVCEFLDSFWKNY